MSNSSAPSRIPAVAVLRGVSQVFLQRNALTGAVMVAGLTIFSWRMALMVLLGSMIQSGAAWLLGRRDNVIDGLMGYNGALVGAAASLDLTALHRAVLITIVGALACVPLHVAFEALFTRTPLKRCGLPVLTAPFCTVAGMLLVVLRPMVPTGGGLTTSHIPLRAGELGILNGIAEVFLADGLAPGAIILAALAISSWRVAAWAVFGSALAAAAGWITGTDPTTVSAGLLGYSAALAAVAIGVTLRADLPFLWRGLAVMGTIGLTLLLRWALSPTPIPVYTWPFVVGTWVTLALTARPLRLHSAPV